MNEPKRVKCLVYTRVMGYLAPTFRYSIGKKAEFYSRKYFSKEKASTHDYKELMFRNREFNKQYSCCGSQEFVTL